MIVQQVFSTVRLIRHFNVRCELTFVRQLIQDSDIGEDVIHTFLCQIFSGGFSLEQLKILIAVDQFHLKN